MSAARMVGDTSLYKKMEQAEQDIKRDIVFAASLVSRSQSRNSVCRSITKAPTFHVVLLIMIIHQKLSLVRVEEGLLKGLSRYDF